VTASAAFMAVAFLAVAFECDVAAGMMVAIALGLAF
jgi:hypothetical protein